MTPDRKTSRVRTILLTLFALTAFAANSVLCRLALSGPATIDAASFTTARLLSGAIVLMLILKIRHSSPGQPSKGSWAAGFMLFLYAACFSYAYLKLNTGTGALILFGSVQISMIVFSLFRGNRLNLGEWLGLLLAFAGLVYLVLPAVSTPSFTGFVLMAIAGSSWGLYTLKGRGSPSPLQDTAWNFLRTTPLVLVLFVFSFRLLHYSPAGLVLALLSGGIASGLGYVVWYTALGGLTATQAAAVQLAVPILAAVGGVVFLSEIVSLRLALASGMILSGILLVVLSRAQSFSSRLPQTGRYLAEHLKFHR